MAGKPIDNTDHYFTRMCDVREEIEQHLIPAMTKLMEAMIKKAIEATTDPAGKGDVLSIDKLATLLLEIENRIEALENQIKEKEEKNDIRRKD